LEEGLVRIAHLIWYALPAYLANAAPVILGGGVPLDMGAKWIDGRRLLGNHKTVRGTISGILVGLLAGLIQDRPIAGILQGVGAMIGDLIGSFIKRRMGLSPGSWAPLIDEEMFIIFALLLSSAVEPIQQSDWVLLLLITPPLHFGANRIKELLKLSARLRRSIS